MKYSKQRELVMNAVTQNPVHPTADFIYSQIRAESPTISLGTVYRNLNLLAEHGMIHKIPIPNGSDRFDFRTDEHYHIICDSCGAVLDVEISELTKLDKQIETSTEFSVTGHSIIINGLCKNCKQIN